MATAITATIRAAAAIIFALLAARAACRATVICSESGVMSVAKAVARRCKLHEGDYLPLWESSRRAPYILQGCYTKEN
jgi:hypothetical protein